MSSGNYESQILEAIQILVNDAVSKAEYDKTIQGTIVRCVDATIGKYIVRYQDSSFYAYSNNTDTTYPAGTNVYVLVPGNNMSKDKSIIGTVDHLGPDYVSIIEGENGYEVTGVNIVNTDGIFNLCSYKSEDIKVLYDRDNEVDVLGLDVFGFENYIKKSKSIICGATFETALQTEQKFRGDYGIVFNLDFIDKSTGEIVTKSYIVNVDQMTGNPYNYTIPSRQYGIFDVDGENFSSIKQVYIFAYNFPNVADGKPNDIFVSKIELSAANALEKEAAATCALTFVTPQGTYFDTNDLDSDKRTLQAQIRIKGNAIDNNSQNVDYYWFRENNSITAKSERYNQYGGAGWECLNNYTVIQEETDNNEAVVQWVKGSYQYITQKADNVARETTYKCVAVYFDGTILSKTIVITNYASNYEISIKSDSGVAFNYDLGKPTLTCYVNGQEETSDAYAYVWSSINSNNQFSTLKETLTENNAYNEAVAQRDALLEKIEAEQLLTASEQENLELYNQKIAQYEYIMRVEKNKIHNLKISAITTFSTYKCSVYKSGIFIGTASVIITNGKSSDGNYTLVIDNGNQVFKYNENGISPANGSVKKPITIMPLGFTLYDDKGQKINHNVIKNIEWKVPAKESLIEISNSHTSPITNEDGTKSYLNVPELNFSIRNTYHAGYDKNEIQLVITHNDKVVTAHTNFTFVKEGESGTNGTDFVCKIIPNAADAQRYPVVTYNEYTKQYSLNYQPQDDKWFTAQLWHNGERIFEGTKSDDKSLTLKWMMLQNYYGKDENDNIIMDSSNFTIDEKTGAVTFDPTEYTDPANIVKCVITYNDVDYYATLPITIIRIAKSDYDVQLVNDSGFREVMYTADGQTPAFDNQPFELTVFQTVDGVKSDISHFTNSEFAVDYYWEDTGSVYFSEWKPVSNLTINSLTESSNLLNQKSFKPVDTYNGLCVNNAVVCRITSKNTGEEIALVHIPIHFYLNRYGNAAMNGWDGNSISLGENGTTILAPQVGAGIKNDDNSFTGVFMGTVKEAGATDTEYGLFGYNKGERTIALSSEDGSARFGRAGLGQIVINPNTEEAVIRSGVYDEDKGIGMEINLTEPSIKFASGKFSVDPEGNVVADSFATREQVEDLEESISYFTIDTNADSILVPVDAQNKPLENKSYIINFYGKYKGKEVTSFTEELVSGTTSGITTKLENNSITFTVDTTKAIANAVNEYVVKLKYTDLSDLSDIKTYVVEKRISVALAVQGKDGEQGKGIASEVRYYGLSTDKNVEPLSPTAETLLPLDYQVVDYIENQSTQFINTDFYPSSPNTKMEVKAAFTSTTTGQLMGSGTSGNERFNLGIEGGRFRFGLGAGWFNANQQIVVPNTNPHVWVLDGGSQTGTIDGYVESTTYSYIPTGRNAIAIFARGNGSSAEGSNRARAKIYYVKIWSDGVLVKDLIPCIRKTDKQVGLYDLVAGAFYTDPNGGNFFYEQSSQINIYSTSIPDMTATNKYLWSYTVIHYTDGVTIETDHAIIGVYGDSGQDGKQGIDGKGVASIVEQYYLSTSNQTQTGGEWKTTQDAWTSGKYFWTREEITWTDGTVTHSNAVLAEGLNKANQTAANADSNANKAKEDAAAAMDKANTTAQGLLDLDTVVSSLQNQIDGAIETWFDNYEPTLNNAPANSWTAEEMERHTGDLFYVIDNDEIGGQCYRFAKINDVFQWVLVEDSGVTKAIAAAANAQATADGKATIFTGTANPTNPQEGDLWMKSDKDGILTYVNGTWVKYNNYTDDTVANEAKDLAGTAKDAADEAKGAAADAKDIADAAKDTADSANETATNAHNEVQNTVKQIEIEYYVSTKPDDLVGGSWSVVTPPRTEGTYIWTRQKMYFVDETKDVKYSDPACMTGATGKPGTAGVGIKSVTNKYALSTSNTEAPASDKWQDAPQTMDSENKYLWNYEIVTYTNNTKTETDPRVIGVYGDKGEDGVIGSDGKGIVSITEYFKAGSSNTSAPTGDWSTTPETVDADKKYLWSYEVIKYTEGEDTETAKRIIGTFGEGTEGKSAYQVWLDAGNTGTEEDYLNSLKGADGQDGADAEKPIVSKDIEGTEVIAEDGRQIKEFIIEGKSEQKVTTQNSNLCPPPTDSRWILAGGAYIDTNGNLQLPESSSTANILIDWNKRSNNLFVKFMIVSGGNAHIQVYYYDENMNKLNENGNAIIDKTDNYLHTTNFGGNNVYGEALAQAKYVKLVIQRSSNFAVNSYSVNNIIMSSTNIDYIPFVPDSPSPDYSSPIKSVGYENLLKANLPATSETRNGVTITNNGKGTYTAKGTSTGSLAIALMAQDEIVLEKGYTYTNSIEILSGSMSSAYTAVTLKDAAGTPTYNYLSVGQDTASISKTPAQDYILNKYEFYISKAGVEVDCTFRVQLLKDARPHAWMPYGTAGLEVVNSGKNKLSILPFNSLSSNGATTSYDGDTLTITGHNTANWYSLTPKFPAYITPGRYLFSCTESNLNRIVISLTFEDGTRQDYWMTNRRLAINITKTVAAVSLYTDGQTIDVDISLQVVGLMLEPMESGTTPTTYESYFENITSLQIQEPLRSLPNGVKDIARIKYNQLSVDRYIKKHIFDENATPVATNYANLYFVRLSDYKGQAGLSNHFKNVINDLIIDNQSANNILKNGEFSFRTGATKDRIYFKLDCTTVDEVKTFFTNNPVEVIYELGDAKVETYDEKYKLPMTAEEFNRYYINDMLNPQIQCTYYTPYAVGIDDMIELVEVQYCIGTSASEPPGKDANWATSGAVISNINTNEYLWSRVRTVKESGFEVFSEYSCLLQAQKELVSQQVEYILWNDDSVAPGEDAAYDYHLEEEDEFGNVIAVYEGHNKWDAVKPKDTLPKTYIHLWSRIHSRYKYTGATLEAETEVYSDYKLDPTWNTMFSLTGELQKAVDKILADISEGYVRISGGAILIGDNEKEPHHIIIMNHNGISFYDTPDGKWPEPGDVESITSTWTIDGTLNMQDINVINLVATSIANQYLVLGNDNKNGANVSGDLDIYDRKGRIAFETMTDSNADRVDGFKVYKYILNNDGTMTPNGHIYLSREHGFREYDASGNMLFGNENGTFTSITNKTQQQIISTTVNNDTFGGQIVPMKVIENEGETNEKIHKGIAFLKI